MKFIILLCIFSIVVLVWGITSIQISHFSSNSLPQIIIDPNTFRFVEKNTERTVQIHGVNIVVKGDPWIPYPFNKPNYQDLLGDSQTRYILEKMTAK